MCYSLPSPWGWDSHYRCAHWSGEMGQGSPRKGPLPVTHQLMTGKAWKGFWGLAIKEELWAKQSWWASQLFLYSPYSCKLFPLLGRQNWFICQISMKEEESPYLYSFWPLCFTRGMFKLFALTSKFKETTHWSLQPSRTPEGKKRSSNSTVFPGTCSQELRVCIFVCLLCTRPQQTMMSQVQEKCSADGARWIPDKPFHCPAKPLNFCIPVKLPRHPTQVIY